mmetsp:Transcript_78990/g.164076  ORF Transcript_78990/g.164076 Transcript_78990/m.164076 type:complete len:83 (-) Transcript_78990:109-357(-)
MPMKRVSASWNLVEEEDQDFFPSQVQQTIQIEVQLDFNKITNLDEEKQGEVYKGFPYLGRTMPSATVSTSSSLPSSAMTSPR